MNFVYFLSLWSIKRTDSQLWRWYCMSVADCKEKALEWTGGAPYMSGIYYLAQRSKFQLNDFACLWHIEKKKTFLSLYSLFKRSIQIWNLCAYKFSTRRHLVKVHVVNLIIGLSQSTKNWDSDFFAYQMMCDSALKKKLKFFQNLIFTGDFFF